MKALRRSSAACHMSGSSCSPRLLSRQLRKDHHHEMITTGTMCHCQCAMRCHCSQACSRTSSYYSPQSLQSTAGQSDAASATRDQLKDCGADRHKYMPSCTYLSSVRSDVHRPLLRSAATSPPFKQKAVAPPPLSPAGRKELPLNISPRSAACHQ